jgi:hypothetical protein
MVQDDGRSDWMVCGSSSTTRVRSARRCGVGRDARQPAEDRGAGMAVRAIATRPAESGERGTQGDGADLRDVLGADSIDDCEMLRAVVGDCSAAGYRRRRLWAHSCARVHVRARAPARCAPSHCRSPTAARRTQGPPQSPVDSRHESDIDPLAWHSHTSLFGRSRTTLEQNRTMPRTPHTSPIDFPAYSLKSTSRKHVSQSTSRSIHPLSGSDTAKWRSGKFARCVSNSRTRAAGVPSSTTSLVVVDRGFGSYRLRSWGGLCKTTPTESSYEGTSQRLGRHRRLLARAAASFASEVPGPPCPVATVVVLLAAAQAVPP